MGEQPRAPAAFRSAADFPASTHTLVPSGAKARVRANIAAIELLDALREAGRPATAAEQRRARRMVRLGRGTRGIRSPQRRLHRRTRQLRDLLTREQYRHAEASVLNAHYTDPAVVAVIWQAMRHAGFAGGRVLEPGCGSGTFIGHAPDDAVMVGVENDDITAAVAARLYPSAQIRHEGFETTRVPENSFAPTVGNVPFGRYAIADPATTRNGTASTTTSSQITGADRTGGYVAVLTSRYTMDSVNPPPAATSPNTLTWLAPSGCPPRRSPASPAPTSSPTC